MSSKRNTFRNILSAVWGWFPVILVAATALFVIISLIVTTVNGYAAQADSSAAEAYRTALTTPCAQEDSDNCYWNAATRGNGVGNSFVVVNGTYFYL